MNDNSFKKSNHHLSDESLNYGIFMIFQAESLQATPSIVCAFYSSESNKRETCKTLLQAVKLHLLSESNKFLLEEGRRVFPFFLPSICSLDNYRAALNSALLAWLKNASTDRALG